MGWTHRVQPEDSFTFFSFLSLNTVSRSLFSFFLLAYPLKLLGIKRPILVRDWSFNLTFNTMLLSSFRLRRYLQTRSQQRGSGTWFVTALCIHLLSLLLPVPLGSGVEGRSEGKGRVLLHKHCPDWPLIPLWPLAMHLCSLKAECLVSTQQVVMNLWVNGWISSTN